MKRILLLLSILAATGGYWAYQNRLTLFPHPAPKEVAPQRWQVSHSDTPITNTTTPVPANATNSSAENATVAVNATLAQIPEDAIVSHGFVRDLAEYLVAQYQPAQTKRNPSAQGRLDLHPKSMNIRYSMDLPGLAVDKAEPAKARKIIFDHVLSDKVLEFLFSAYTPLLLDNLDMVLTNSTRTLADGREAHITENQRKEMFVLLSVRLRALGQTAAALAREASIPPLVAKYLEEMDKVNEAHFNYWNLQSENATEDALDAASTQIKLTIQAREMSRQRLLQTIVAKANPQGMEAAELLYISQWIYRRNTQNPDSLPVVAKAADLLVKTGAAMEERSRQPAGRTATNATTQ